MCRLRDMQIIRWFLIGSVWVEVFFFYIKRTEKATTLLTTEKVITALTNTSRNIIDLSLLSLVRKRALMRKQWKNFPLCKFYQFLHFILQNHKFETKDNCNDSDRFYVRNCNNSNAIVFYNTRKIYFPVNKCLFVKIFPHTSHQKLIWNIQKTRKLETNKIYNRNLFAEVHAIVTIAMLVRSN